MRRIKVIFILLSVAAAFSVHAAPSLGYVSKASMNSARDNMLTLEDMDKALLEGIISTGITLDKSKKTNPAVIFESHTAYAPNNENLRIMSGTVAVLEDTRLRGIPYSVRSCQMSYQSWNSGPSEQMNVNELLVYINKFGAAFAKKCLK